MPPELSDDLEQKDAPYEELEYKTLPFAMEAGTDDLQPDEFKGYLGITKTVDRGGDVILPGAFKSAIPWFLANGHIYFNHDHSEPIGKPLAAHEDEKGLFIKGRISDTTRGRDAKTLLRDGVIDKMSIGYKPDRPRFLSHAEGKALFGDAGYKAALEGLPANRARVRAHAGFKFLFDGSLVTVPMHPDTNVTGVKSLLQAGMTFDDHFATTLAVNAEMLTRFAELKALRLQDDRDLSEAKRLQLTTLETALCEQIETVREVLAAIPPSEAETKAQANAEAELKQAALREFARFQHLEARLAGNL